MNQGVGAEKQAHRVRVEAMVGIVEGLVKVVDAEQDLVRHPWSEHGVQCGRIVVDVNRSFFEVVRQVGTGGS